MKRKVGTEAIERESDNAGFDSEHVEEEELLCFLFFTGFNYFSFLVCRFGLLSPFSSVWMAHPRPDCKPSFLLFLIHFLTVLAFGLRPIWFHIITHRLNLDLPPPSDFISPFFILFVHIIINYYILLLINYVLY